MSIYRTTRNGDELLPIALLIKEENSDVFFFVLKIKTVGKNVQDWENNTASMNTKHSRENKEDNFP